MPIYQGSLAEQVPPEVMAVELGEVLGGLGGTEPTTSSILPVPADVMIKCS